MYNTKVNIKLEFVYCFARRTKAMAFSDFGLQSKSEYFPGTVLHKVIVNFVKTRVLYSSSEVKDTMICQSISK